MHRTRAELEAYVGTLRGSPRDEGTLELVVRRPAIGAREVLAEGELDTEVGLVGDNWPVKPTTSTPDRSPHPEKQLTLMNHRMVAFLAGDDPDRRALAGDQLYVDLDLSATNLPAGTRLAIGTAVVEVTEPPHRGCAKFLSRYGEEAMRFVNGRVGRELRLRGINAKVVVDGTVHPGDTVRKAPAAQLAEAAARPASSRATGTRNGEQET